MAHTQAPWVIHREFGGYTIRPAEPVTGAQNICALSTLVPRDGREGTTQANAALIAAAPDLLAVLKKLIAIGDASVADDIRRALRPHERASFDAIITEARAAIAKAEAQS